MPKAKSIAVALLAVVVVAVGIRGVVRGLDARSARTETPAATKAPGPSISMAKLSSTGTPDNCADVTLSVGKEIPFEKLRARGFVVLKATCKESFSGLHPLASCTRFDPDGDAQTPSYGEAYYYDVGTLDGDDTYRGQCLGTGGTWEITPRDDPQYVSARARMGPSAPHHEFDSLMELMP